MNFLICRYFVEFFEFFLIYFDLFELLLLKSIKIFIVLRVDVVNDMDEVLAWHCTHAPHGTSVYVCACN